MVVEVDDGRVLLGTVTPGPGGWLTVHSGLQGRPVTVHQEDVEQITPAADHPDVQHTLPARKGKRRGRATSAPAPAPAVATRVLVEPALAVPVPVPVPVVAASAVAFLERRQKATARPLHAIRPTRIASTSVCEAAVMEQPLNLNSVLASFTETWSPRTVAVVNDYDVRVAKAHGEFARHSHPDTDEFFLVLEGELTIRLDAGEVTLSPGDVYVVPRGVPHQPVAVTGAQILLMEPTGTLNTGDTPSDLTAERRLVE